MKRGICVASLAAALFMFSIAGTVLLTQAQQPDDEIALVVEDMVDWGSLFNALEDSTIASEIEDHFSAGRKCRHLGIEVTYENGDERDYDVQASFKASSGTRYVMDWTYDKSSSSGTSPSVPPDSVGAPSETTPSTGPSNVLFSTQLAFDFFMLVLDSPPSMVSTELSTQTLKSAWVEIDGSTYYLFLKFFDSSENPTTKRVWSTYYNGAFGTLFND